MNAADKVRAGQMISECEALRLRARAVAADFGFAGAFALAGTFLHPQGPVGFLCFGLACLCGAMVAHAGSVHRRLQGIGERLGELALERREAPAIVGDMLAELSGDLS